VPDFPTGGIMDASDYRDGLRGGKIRCRARIDIEKKGILRITEIPFGTTTGGVMDSIVAAADKNKIKIQKIEDNTAAHADIPASAGLVMATATSVRRPTSSDRTDLMPLLPRIAFPMFTCML
jgi:hypothetical protein